ncbi:MAG: TRAP transporter small permease [Burkholderiales bacterium]|nr:TRAP transporter small permease [Burkholderiales bacterium]
MSGKFERRLTRALEGVIVACLATMAVLVFGNVVLRYAFDSGLAVSEELSRLLFVWLIFLGAILASRQHAHLGFDTLLQKLPAGVRKAVIVANAAAMLVACVFFVIGGWEQTKINLGNRYPVLDIPYAWLYAVAVVFGVGLAISIALNVRDVLTGRPSDAELVLTQNLQSRVEQEVAELDAQRRARDAKGEP